MDSRTRSMIRNLEVRKKVTRLKQEKRKYTKKERNMILKVDRIRFSKLNPYSETYIEQRILKRIRYAHFVRLLALLATLFLFR